MCFSSSAWYQQPTDGHTVICRGPLGCAGKWAGTSRSYYLELSGIHLPFYVSTVLQDHSCVLILLVFNNYFIFNYLYICGGSLCPWRPKMGVGSHAAGVTSYCEPPNLGVRNCTCALNSEPSSHLFSFCFFAYWERVSCHPGWCQTHTVVEATFNNECVHTSVNTLRV